LNTFKSGTKPMGVSVVIPNWNGAELLSANLSHVLTICSEYSGQTELIVVDDCSADDSVSLLNKKFTHKVQVIWYDDNKGFSEV
jgi:glycosyltransferase involved in cell wall biosynthesis